MTHEEKDRLIRALMTIVGEIADCVGEVPDDKGSHLEVVQPQLFLHTYTAAYAVYWMARAMGYRSDDRGSLALADKTCCVRLTTEAMKYVRAHDKDVRSTMDDEQ